MCDAVIFLTHHLDEHVFKVCYVWIPSSMKLQDSILYLDSIFEVCLPQSFNVTSLSAMCDIVVGVISRVGSDVVLSVLTINEVMWC